MTIVEYRKEKERQKELHNFIMKLMIQYHLEEKDALRFYYERIAPIYEAEEIHKEGCSEGNSSSK